MSRGHLTRLALAAVGIAAVAAAAWLLVVPRLRPHVFHGTVIQSTTPAPTVELISDTGAPVRLSDLAGDVVAVYFGYTHCPDVCPATLARLDDALDLLGSESDDVQVVMVSVDPERDTPALLHEYVAHFDERFMAMTGTVEDVAAVATLLGVYFARNEDAGAAGYLVDHTATIMVFDRDGYLKLVLSPTATADDIAADLGYLL
jgi:protein SCO1/2